MLISFSEILRIYRIQPRGVFHVGANTGQEAQSYFDSGIERVIWVEAIPKVFNELCNHVYPFSPKMQSKSFNECVSDTDGQEVEFKITNNAGESSSFLDLETHKQAHPEVHVVETIKCITKKLDTLISENNIDVSEYDFLNMDLQGAELLALKGMKDNLHKVKYAYLEVNREELYKDCARVEQLDEFLKEFGLHRVQTEWTNFGWGDAYYSR